MKKDNNTLKTYFETGDYPTEVQFADLIDSFLNIEEEDAVTGITNNGDGTYTFQLLSGGTETLDVQSLPDSIPISTIAGLQALLDGKVAKNGDTMTGTLVTPGIDMNQSANFLKPTTHADKILIVGGNGQGDKDWSSIHMYSNGVVRINDNDIWHAGNDGNLSKNQLSSLSNLDSGISRSGSYSWGSGAVNAPSTYGTLLTFVNSGGDYNGTNNWLNQLAFGTDNEVYFRQKVNADPFDYWGKLWKDGLNTQLSIGNGNAFKVTTNSGYLEIGPQNTSHCHFYTDRSNFYFNKELRVDTGIISSYNEDLILTRAGSSQDRLRVTTGYCISDQNFLIYATDAQPLSIRGSSNNANTPCYARFEQQDGTDRGYIGYGSSSNSHLYLYNNEGTDCYLMLKTNGEAEFNNNVRADNFILSSDRRLKEKIMPLERSLDIEFVEFEMKKNQGEKRYGVIAQDVEEKHPELVFTDEEGMKQVKYIDLLVAKIAELEKRIKTLEKN